jgi:hypothetical protein
VSRERDEPLIDPEIFFDEGVEAARNACVAGASLVAAWITAAAYYDNPFTGLPALRACMARLRGVGLTLPAWHAELSHPEAVERADAPLVPGFGFVTSERARRVVSECRRLVDRQIGGAHCAFFLEHHAALASMAGPLNATGLSALLFLDQGLDVGAAELRFLSWRCETALIEAEKTRRAGVGAFSFLSERHVYEGPMPPAAPPDTADLIRHLGLDRDD